MQNEINQDHEIRSFVLNRGHSPTPKLSLKASPHQIYSHANCPWPCGVTSLVRGDRSSAIIQKYTT